MSTVKMAPAGSSPVAIGYFGIVWRGLYSAVDILWLVMMIMLNTMLGNPHVLNLSIILLILIKRSGWQGRQINQLSGTPRSLPQFRTRHSLVTRARIFIWDIDKSDTPLN